MPNTHILTQTYTHRRTAIALPNMWLQACIHNRAHTQVLVLVCTSVCVCVCVLASHRRRAKSSFLWEAPLTQRWPHPWPSPPWIWQGLIRLIFHLAEGESESIGSHTCTPAHNLHTLYTYIFQTVCPYLSMSLSLSTSLLFLFPPSTPGKPVHYSASVNTHKCAHTAGRLCGSGAWSGSRAMSTSKCSGAIMIGRYGSQGPCL